MQVLPVHNTQQPCSFQLPLQNSRPERGREGTRERKSKAPCDFSESLGALSLVRFPPNVFLKGATVDCIEGFETRGAAVVLQACLAPFLCCQVSTGSRQS